MAGGALLGVVSLAAALAWSGPATADPDGAIARAEFSWDAPAECPDQGAVQQMVESKLGAPLDRAIGRISVITRIRQERGGYGMRLWAVTSTGTHERELWHERCDVLAQATAVVVAIAIDPAMRNAVEIEPPTQEALGGDTSLGPVTVCTLGQEQCACGPLGACEGSLVCLSRTCVRPPRSSPPPPTIAPAGSSAAEHNAALLEERRRSDRLIVAGHGLWVSGVVVLTLVGGLGLVSYLDDRSNGAARATMVTGLSLGGIGLATGFALVTIGYRGRAAVPPRENLSLGWPPRRWRHRRLRTFTRSRPASTVLIPPM